MSSGILHGVNIWGLLGTDEAVTGWASTDIANGMSIPLAQSGSLLLPDNIWGATYFANLPIAPPLQATISFSVLAHTQVQSLEPGRGNSFAFRISICPPFCSEPSRGTSFSGEGVTKASLPWLSSLTHLAKTCYLYCGTLSSSGTHKFLLFYILSQDCAKAMSTGYLTEQSKKV